MARELTDAEVFGTPAPAPVAARPAAPARELSDAEVFGAPDAPDYSGAFRNDVGLGERALRAGATGGEKFTQFANMLLGMPSATLADKVHGLLSGREETGARDTVGGWIDDSERRIAALSPNAATENVGMLDEIVHGVGATVPDLALMGLTGGESAPAQAAVRQSVRREIGNAARQAVTTSARASAVPSLERGVEVAGDVVQAGGSTPEALVGGANAAAVNTLANAIPASASGSLPVRLAQGAASNPVADVLQTLGENAALDDRLGLDHETSVRDLVISALTGAPMAGLMGERGPEPIRQPDAPLDLADLTPPVAPQAAPATPAPAASAAAPRQGEPAPRGPGPLDPAQVAAQQRMDAQRAAAGDVQSPAPPIVNPAPPEAPVRAPEPQGDTPPPDRLAPESRDMFGRDAGWIIRDKATGKAVLETRDRAKVDALNTAKYEAVPVGQHLTEVNDPTSLAGRAARGEAAPAAPAAPPRQRFASPAEHDTGDFVARAAERGVPEDVARELAPQAPVDRVTGFTDGRQGALDRTLERAQQHVEATGEDAVYVSADIANLGGLNAHVGNRAEDANAHYRAMTEIMRAELEATGADVVPLRTGGDEVGAVVVNATQADVDAALSRARSRIEQYAAENGLDAIPHPKGGAPGTGLHFGSAQIVPGVTIKDILDRADAGIDLGKTGGASVRSQPTQAPEPGAPAGEPAVATGTAAPRDGVRPQGGEPAPEPRAAAAEPVAVEEVTPPASTIADDAPPMRAQNGDVGDNRTGAANRVTDAEREQREQPRVAREKRPKLQAAVDEARTEVEADPKVARAAVERLRRAGSTGITEQDQARVLAHKVALRAKRDGAADRMTDAGLDEAERAAARSEFAQAEADLNDVDEALVASGTEWGRFGAMRAQLIAPDYTLEAMERQARIDRGRPLTTKEAAAVKQAHEALAQAEAERDAALDRLDEVQEQLDVAHTYAELFRAMGGKRPRAEGDLETTLRARADKARERIAKRAGIANPQRQGGALDVALLADYADIGAYHVFKGAADLADFTRRMVASVGEAFERLSDAVRGEVFRAAKTKADASAATPRAKREPKAKAPDAPLTPAQVLAEAADTGLTHKVVYELARAHVQAGLRGEDAVMAAVHKDVLESGLVDKDEFTERDTRRLFAEYGKARFPSKAADKVELRQLRTLVQIQESIDRLNEGLKPLKSGPQRDKQTQAVRAKRAQLIALLRQQAKDAAADPDKVARYNEARARALQAQIEDIDKAVMVGERPHKDATPVPATPEVERLRALRDRLKAELDEILPAERRGVSDAQYNARASKSLDKRIAELRERLVANDYATRKAAPRPLTKEVADKRLAWQDLRNQWERERFEYQMAQRTPLEKLFGYKRDALSLMRAFMLSFDDSAFGNQGGLTVIAHPWRSRTALVKGLQSLVSRRSESEAAHDLKARPNYHLYVKYKLPLVGEAAYGKHSQDETYATRWLEKIVNYSDSPVKRSAQRTWNAITLPVRASQSAYNTTINQLRADAFDALWNSTMRDHGAITDAQGEGLAKSIAVLTGRSSIKQVQQAASFMQNFFLAWHWTVSRFQAVTGYDIITAPPGIRKHLLAERGRIFAGLGAMNTLLYLAALGWNDDDEEVTNFDPRSGNFMKYRFGDTWIGFDPGLGATVNFLTRVLSGETVSKGKVVPLRQKGTLSTTLGDEPKKPDRFHNFQNLLYDWWAQRAAPPAGYVAAAVTGKNAIHQEFDATDDFLRMALPINFDSVKPLLTTNGIPFGFAALAWRFMGAKADYRDPDLGFGQRDPLLGDPEPRSK